MDTSFVNIISLEALFNFLVLGIFLIYWGMTFVIIYHLIRFGIGVQPKRLAAIFFLGSVVLSGVAIICFKNVDINMLKTLVNL